MCSFPTHHQMQRHLKRRIGAHAHLLLPMSSTMEKFAIAAILLVTVSISHQDCPDGWRQSTLDSSKCYLIVANKKIWFEAGAFCARTAPTSVLTSITSAYEQYGLNAIVTDSSTVASCDQFWIGANDFDQTGKFVWTDGQPFRYTNWGTGQPDLSQQCVSAQLRTTGKWKTEPCGLENCFVCELYNYTSSTPSSTVGTTTATPPMTDCYDWRFLGGVTTNGIYPIEPPGIPPFDVYCDMTTSGGGWTVFQRRLNGNLPFYDKPWAQYKRGFMDSPVGNFWLGNDKLHLLSSKDTDVTLRIDIHGDRCQHLSCASPVDPNIYVFGEYTFHVDNEGNGYMMHTTDIKSGNMTSPGLLGFSRANGQKFATIDRTYGDGNIVTFQLGAWWFIPMDSHNCALNGKYNSNTYGIFFDRRYNSLNYDIVPVMTEMKLRKVR